MNLDCEHWAAILHETATIITALAAAIAAGSSLKNGRKLGHIKKDASVTAANSKGLNGNSGKLDMSKGYPIQKL